MDTISDPRTIIPTVDFTGLHDDPGSRGWIIAYRSMMLSCLSDIKNNRETGKNIYSQIQKHGGWQHLSSLRGSPFRSFEEFCKSPNGFGMPQERIEARLLAGPIEQGGVAPKKTHAEAGAMGGRGRKASANGTSFSHGTNQASTIVARLKTERPDIAAQLASGKFKSARAAGKAAGIVHDPDPGVELRRWWKKASAEVKKAFIKEVSS